jgi:uncharacterized membrane protein
MPSKRARTAATPAAPAPRKGGRLLFVDLLRGLAVVVMIETHVMNALMREEFRDQSWFAILNFFNGLVAPSFLFCAGLGFWIATERKSDDYLRFRAPVWVYLRRLLYILCVGYALHLPSRSFSYLLQYATPIEIEKFWQVDILQTISWTLTFALIVLLLTRSVRRMVWTLAGLGVILIAVARPVWIWGRFSGFGLVTTGIFAETSESHFPLVPWSMYLFAGIVAQWSFSRAADPRRWAIRVAALGAALWVIARIIIELNLEAPPYDLHRSVPTYLMTRLGLVLLAYALCWWYASKRSPDARSRLAVFGRESLLIYFVHLIIVYGSAANQGISWGRAHTFDATESWLAAAGLILAMYFLAWGWNSAKRRWPRYAQWGIYAFSGGALVLFAIWPSGH